MHVDMNKYGLSELTDVKVSITNGATYLSGVVRLDDKVYHPKIQVSPDVISNKTAYVVMLGNLLAGTKARHRESLEIKRYMRLAKKNILKALTQDFDYRSTTGRKRHNQAIFMSQEGCQVFINTDLSMVMDKVIWGLYRAMGERLTAEGGADE